MALPAGSSRDAAPCAVLSQRQMQMERQRERELAKYFRSASIEPVRAGVERAIAAGAQRSKDATLTALAQLGALKLQCERSFISIIDQTHQYIIGEATRTHSLQKDAAASLDDSLYLGVRALELHWGVCPTTIQVFTGVRKSISTENVSADQSQFVIRDFTREATYRDREYIAGWPHMRSYAEVPLKTQTGSVIGSYCVVDTKPRSYSPLDIESLTEIADSIMGHLDLLRIKQDHERAQKLVHGLSSFVRASLDPNARGEPIFPILQSQDTLPHAETDGRFSEAASPDLGAANTFAPTQSTESRAPSEAEALSFNLEKPLSRLDLDEEAVMESKPERQTDPISQDWQTPSDGMVADSHSLTVSVKQQKPEPAESGDDAVFSKVAHLACRDNDVDGVLILDSEVDESFESTKDTFSPFSPRGQVDIGYLRPELMCKQLGLALNAKGDSDSDRRRPKTRSIPAAMVRRLLEQHPAGTILTREDDAPALDQRIRSSASLESDFTPTTPQAYGAIDTLFECLGSPLSVVLAPMWGANHRKWSLCMICWTSDRSRTFDNDDISLLSALNNSIVADIARKDAISTFQTKNDFMSTISHELRSPLHGILASVELLEEKQNDSEAKSFLRNIQSCGTTLLDTMDQLLEFTEFNSVEAHINSVESAADVETPTSATSASRKISGISTTLVHANLGALVEEVVVSMEMGHAYKQSHNQAMKIERRGSTTGISPVELVPPTTLLTIDPRAAKPVQLQVGALRRIIMVLCSNSLRFTSRGHIEIDVSLLSESEQYGQAIRLSVRDSGRGIAREYQESRLFDPFSQEHPVQEGTGLGLHIARRLVREHKGFFDVRSEIGVGTVMEVIIPFGDKMILESPSDGTDVYLPKSLVTRVEGLSVCLHQSLRLPDTSKLHPPLDLHDSTETVLARSLYITLSECFGMKIVREDQSPDVWIESEKGELFISTSQRCANCPGLEVKAPISPKAVLATIVHVLGVYSDLDDTARHVLRHFAPNKVSNKESPPAVQQPAHATPETSDHPINNAESSQNEGSGEVLESAVQTSKNFLLVDDNQINLKVLGTCISKMGYAHTYANDGQAAVEAFQQQSSGPYSVVFMDLSMPVLDGFEATKRMRKLEIDEGWPRARIVAISAFGTEESKGKAKDCGCDLFLAKPVSMKKVKDMVRLWEEEALEAPSHEVGNAIQR